MSVRKSLAWSYGAQLIIFTQTFTVSVIVARILGPYEMGIFAVGLSLAGVLSILSAFGVAPYLIRHESPDEDLRAMLFTVNGMLNIFVSVAILVIATVGPFVGMDANVRKVLLLLAIPPLIAIFDFLPAAFMQREMAFKAISLIAISKTTINSIVLLTLVLSGIGYVSLPLAMIGSALFNALLVNGVGHRNARLRIGFAGWRDLTKFGLQMMSIGGLAALVQRLSELIIARFLGIAALGVYSRASNLTNQLWDNVYGLSTRVIFAQMAKEMREEGTVRKTFIHGLAIITAAVWPLLLGIAVLSRPIIESLYGDAWIAAAGPLSLLLLACFVALGFGMNWELCVLQSRTGWQARNEAYRSMVGLVSFTIGASFSIVGAACGRVCEALAGLVLFAPTMREMAGTDPGEIAQVYRQGAVLSTAAVGPALVVMLVTGWSPHTSWWLVGPAIAIGVFLWLLLAWRLHHPLFDEISRLTRTFMTRKQQRTD